eukprot:scaffold654820_cov59-Prasinocladus_malaysianus.AAC.1
MAVSYMSIANCSNRTLWDWLSSLKKTLAPCLSIAFQEMTYINGRVVSAASEPSAAPHIETLSFNRNDTIITWSDPEVGTDIALSFQEAQGCNY